MAKSKKSKSKGPAVASDGMDDSWRAQDDLRTLQRATEISSDTARMKAARLEAERQKKALDRISRLDGKKL